jgi:hypothetical protein
LDFDCEEEKLITSVMNFLVFELEQSMD